MRRVSIFFISLVFVIALPSFVFASTDKIDKMDVEVKINPDSSIDIQEDILYDFGTQQRHGIYRDITYRYNARGGNFKLRISDVSVFDENGIPYDFTQSSVGDDWQIKIGDADKYVTGKKTYVISYKVKRAINYFDTFDELYWNAIGHNWDVANIRNSSVKVILPQGVEKQDLQISCYLGVKGSKDDCSFEILSDMKSVTFNPRDLSYGEGMTFAIGFPKGIVTQPAKQELILETIKDNWIFALPFVVFLVMFYLWWTRGRDPKGRETIIAEFDAPDNLTPLEVGIIIDERSDSRDISAQIIHLATRGYLKIKQTRGSISILSSKDYELEMLKQPDENLKYFEKRIMIGLFKYGVCVKISDLLNKFYSDAKDINKNIYKELTSLGYFPKNPDKVRNIFSVTGLIITFAAFIFGPVIGGGEMRRSSFLVAAIFISGIIIFVFSALMPKKTRKGVLAKEHILGLKQYMSVAEKDRIEFHNAPEKNPEHFEKLLPFAMALGVEKQWAKQFEGIYNQQPSWYVGPIGSSFSPSSFASDMSSFSSATAASGGSGSSGGGSSGGGGGGGGGGSW